MVAGLEGDAAPEYQGLREFQSPLLHRLAAAGDPLEPSADLLLVVREEENLPVAQIQQVIGTLIGGGDVIYMDSVGLVVQGHAAAHHRPQAAALEILQDAAVDLLLKVDHANGMHPAHEVPHCLRRLGVIAQQHEGVFALRLLLQQLRQGAPVEVKPQMG